MPYTCRVSFVSRSRPFARMSRCMLHSVNYLVIHTISAYPLTRPTYITGLQRETLLFCAGSLGVVYLLCTSASPADTFAFTGAFFQGDNQASFNSTLNSPGSITMLIKSCAVGCLTTVLSNRHQQLSAGAFRSSRRPEALISASVTP